MRVALLSYNAQPGDAIGNQVAEKLSFFRERGAEVRVFVQVRSPLHPVIEPFCNVLKKPQAHGEAWQFLSSCNLVIAEYGQYYTLLQLLPLLSGSKTRIVLDYHGVTPPELWSAHNREALEKGVQNRGLVWCADAVIVHSQFTLRELRDDIRLPIERLHLLPYPTDLSQFCPRKVEHDWRQALGLRDEALLLYVGRLAPNKRVPLIVEALARLRDVTPAVHALIVGPTNDLYRSEADRCERLARELGVADRLHLAGPQTGSKLHDAYRAADVFVMPSAWESFCIPVIEAMACGVPVVAARTTVLPETVASAGLTFAPDDADDLARQIRRVLSTQYSVRSNASPRRIGIVTCRYGSDFAGGEQRSLSTMARALTQAGCAVEVFTTTARTTSDWRDELPVGSSCVDGIAVHRFRLDPHDTERHRRIVQRIRHANGRVSPALEQDYLQCSIRSTALLEALQQRHAEFDALIVGPYLYALTYEVARRFPEKTLLVPCFHDEPFARLSVWRTVYEQVGGILYHSPEEQAFAERELGLNHPGATLLGTFLDTQSLGNSQAGQALAGADRYLVYCGRYCEDKDLPRLLEYARRFEQEHPGRFRLVLMGDGQVPIPREAWARDLGFVGEVQKRDVLAGAAALVQLSPNESLSLVALEAWAQGVPVIAWARCAVLVGQIERSGGGRCVADYADFAGALDDCWQRPTVWQEYGKLAQAYVRTMYGSQQDFTARLLGAINELTEPLREKMCRRGLERAKAFDRALWRQRFGGFVERLLHAAPLVRSGHVEVRPRHDSPCARADSETTLVPVRVVNHSTHPLVADGPERTVLHCRVFDAAGTAIQTASLPLPRLVIPQQTLSAVMGVPVPHEPGAYRVAFWAGEESPTVLLDSQCQLIVTEQVSASEHCASAPLEEVQTALIEARKLQQLPDEYVDVTEGALAKWKRLIKQKLLGNFKHGYVDVLSHQQTAFNTQLLTAVHELAECFATLDHAVHVLNDEVARLRKRVHHRGTKGTKKTGRTAAKETR